MAYAVGDTISNSDYNGLLNNTASGTPNAGVAARGINYIAGTGAGTYGLGQTELNSVGSADTIQAAQWNSLFTFMNNIANHSNDTLTSTTAVSAGDVIAIKAALESNLNTLAASVAAGCPLVTSTALTPSAGTAATQTTEGWDSTSTQELTVTFASANAMRWFFNAGGKVRVTVGTTEASLNAKDQAFKDLGTALGNLDIGGHSLNRSGTGETSTSYAEQSGGFYDLTGTADTYVSLIKLTSDNTFYTSNTIEIFAKINAAIGTATVMTIKMVATDAAADDQYTAGNTPNNIPAAVKDTPRMVTTLFTLTPNNTEGLTPPNYGPASAPAPALAVLTNDSIT
jgi:hypothetical protein